MFEVRKLVHTDKHSHVSAPVQSAGALMVRDETLKPETLEPLHVVSILSNNFTLYENRTHYTVPIDEAPLGPI